MRIARPDLDSAVQRQILTQPQADALWGFLGERYPDEAEEGAARAARPSRFTGVNVAYYLGALIVIGAMGWLMTLGWEKFGGGGILVLSLAYAAAFVKAGAHLLARGERTPGGLLVTMAVCMTPLAVYGFERMTGLWADGDPGSYRGFFPYVKGSWFFMEVATIAAGVIALRKVKFPFLVAPIAFTLWFMSMDVAPLVLGGSFGDSAREISLAFGVAMLFAAYLVDHRTDEDYAYWLYLFGMVAFWTSLTLMDSEFLYALLNLGLIVVSVLLRRRVFLVFGALGFNGYLVYLSHRVFKDSMAFPFVLTLLGLGIIAAAVKYQRNRLRIEAWIASWVPPFVRDMLPEARIARG